MNVVIHFIGKIWPNSCHFPSRKSEAWERRERKEKQKFSRGFCLGSVRVFSGKPRKKFEKFLRPFGLVAGCGRKGKEGNFGVLLECGGRL